MVSFLGRLRDSKRVSWGEGEQCAAHTGKHNSANCETSGNHAAAPETRLLGSVTSLGG